MTPAAPDDTHRRSRVHGNMARCLRGPTLAILAVAVAYLGVACRERPDAVSTEGGLGPRGSATKPRAEIALEARRHGARPGMQRAVRAAAHSVLAAARGGDVPAVRAALSADTRKRFDELLSMGATSEDARDAALARGWDRVARAHAGLEPSGLTDDAAVEWDGARAWLDVGSEAGTAPRRLPFLFEEGAWRLDYAGVVEAAAILDVLASHEGE